mgnify:CR=1 FL=1
MAAVPGAKRVINRISLERQLLQIFKGGLTVQDLAEVVDTAEVERTYPRQARTPFNVTGQPAMSVPSGWSTGGLPVALTSAILLVLVLLITVRNGAGMGFV